MKENQISEVQRLGRKILSSAERRLLPTNVIHVGDGLQRAKELRRSGRDIFFMTTHPSETDEPREYAAIWQEDEFKDSKIIVPNAWDQNTFLAKTLATVAGIDLYPIVTQDSKDRGAAKDKYIGYGNIAFYRRIQRSTGDPKSPATVFLAPDAGRRSVLQAPSTRAAEFLVTAGGDNLAVVFMGVEINGVEDYSQASGKNIGKTYTIRIGKAFTNEELLAELQDYRQKNSLQQEREKRPYQHLDRWIYETQFPQLIPDTYLP